MIKLDLVLIVTLAEQAARQLHYERVKAFQDGKITDSFGHSVHADPHNMAGYQQCEESTCRTTREALAYIQTSHVTVANIIEHCLDHEKLDAPALAIIDSGDTEE